MVYLNHPLNPSTPSPLSVAFVPATAGTQAGLRRRPSKGRRRSNARKKLKIIAKGSFQCPEPLANIPINPRRHEKLILRICWVIVGEI